MGVEPRYLGIGKTDNLVTEWFCELLVYHLRYSVIRDIGAKLTVCGGGWLSGFCSPSLFVGPKCCCMGIEARYFRISRSDNLVTE